MHSNQINAQGNLEREGGEKRKLEGDPFAFLSATNSNKMTKLERSVYVFVYYGGDALEEGQPMAAAVALNATRATLHER